MLQGQNRSQLTQVSNSGSNREAWLESNMGDGSPHTDTSPEMDPDDRNQRFDVVPSNPFLASGSGGQQEKFPEQKTLRRLAQNREAARKSRLRKKAYVQQLENSRLKLTQLEQEVQRARKQGVVISNSGDQSQPNGGNEQQLASIDHLQQTSLQAEEALSQGMDALQHSLAETLASDAPVVPAGSSGMANYMGQMAMAMGKLGSLENFLRQLNLVGCLDVLDSDLLLIQEYRQEFAKRSSRVSNRPDHCLLGVFLNGLKDELKSDVRIHKPRTVYSAMSLALEFESKLTNHQPGKNASCTPNSKPYEDSKPTTFTPSQTSQPKNTFRTFETEKQNRFLKGECFRCGDKYEPGHLCKAGTLKVLEANEDVEETLTTDLTNLESDPEETTEISFHTILGKPHPTTMKVHGMLHSTEVLILIDGGSTHNFISDVLVNELKLATQPLAPFGVQIGNGDVIRCGQICKNLPVQINDIKITQDFHPFSLGGADLVLGIQWLATLNTVQANWKEMFMVFKIDGKQYKLQGVVSGPQKSSSFQHLAIDPEIPPCIPAPLQPIVTSYMAVFEEPKTYPPTRSQDHSIPLLPNSTPPNIRPYRYPHSQKAEIEKQVEQLMATAFIQPSTSPFSSPVLLVKKDNTWRMCVDYRALNKITIADKYPIPNIDELLDELYGATVFSKLDLRSGYYQIRCRPAVRISGFHPGDPAVMNDLFRLYLRRFILVFFDDILIYSPSMEQHKSHLEQALKLLHDNRFFAKLSKCCFGQEQVVFLGHVISSEGVSVEEEKILAVKSWPTPTTVKEVRALKSFNDLKHALLTTPVLRLPDFSKPFVIECDASSDGVEAILSQEDHPVAYFSKGFSPSNRFKSAYDREMSTLVLAVQKWSHYLLGRHFLIRTDHYTLKFLLEQRITSTEQQRLLLKLMPYDFSIVHKVGKENKGAYALSRRPHSGELLTLIVPYSVEVDDIKAGLQTDLFTSDLMKKLQIDPSSVPDFSRETKNAELEQQLVDQDDMIKLLRQNLQKAQDRMTKQIRSGGNSRFRAVGLAYELELPPEARIHPVFHISMLKHANGSFLRHQFIPLRITKDWKIDLQPNSVITHRWIYEAGQPVLELLISCCNRPVEEAARETYDLVAEQFLNFALRSRRFTGREVMIKTN
uniref:Transposon Ty3-G Gag-Pol polyprotein n=1 Tax=Tanacetum cinerariifolium TaxID=118510 RepID=A0A6L2KHC9_TANCI|nr:transposon Ty3-G Gag-Pol polyprotein [Tanacetum cinerariifolium]